MLLEGLAELNTAKMSNEELQKKVEELTAAGHKHVFDKMLGMYRTKLTNAKKKSMSTEDFILGCLAEIRAEIQIANEITAVLQARAVQTNQASPAES